MPPAKPLTLPRSIPPPLSRALTLLRKACHWTPGKLAAASGVSYQAVRAWETGDRTPTREKLERLAAVMGLPSEAIDHALVFLQAVVPEREDGAEAGPGVESLERLQVERGAGRFGFAMSQLFRQSGYEELRRARLRRARERAAAQWQELRGWPFAETCMVVEGDEEYWSWAFCERLCAVSRKAASHSPQRAQQWAELALRLARQMEEGKVHPARLEGYCLGHWANARRVANDHEAAARAFQRGWELWGEGGRELRDEALDVAWLLSLEASLRLDQRRPPEALALLDRALELAKSELVKAPLLLNKAHTLELCEDYEGALSVLLQMDKLAKAVDRQLLLQVRYATVTNLGRLGRYLEAESLVPQVRDQALELNNDLELVRVLWLEGWVAAGLGRNAEARTALEQVQRDFIARDLAYDASLVSLELAELCLRENRLEEVRSLAVEMMPIFTSRQIHREALAALRLFCAATERGEITLHLTRRLVRYLERARNDQNLRFET